ncbi:helix-turn-helix domain-containing protein [Allosaccharopolyspora coralli]|uniref:Helix-turn-helix domain-containing protein n=1 Tax=Allosaccharopolyspora coralli TaxID=2665642 RepID=A0A5Q3Q6D2_9PSEU|nr:IclR family transcriptional regulator [Allosaccharopolyspora coralli]QGK69006.1 helix-turn-helix domain-containing protein [Allosaccharopolyspora coralli]
MRATGKESSTSPAVGHALDILVRLAQRPGPVRASALMRDLGLPRSSAYHILSVLEDRGFVVYLPQEKAYGLGAFSFEIGSAYLRHESLERLARPILRRLAARLGQTVQLGILHGAETVYLLKQPPDAEPTADVALITDVGVRLPSHLTANGRAILADTPGAQLRALFAGPADFVTRTGSCPRCLADLRRILERDRARGWSEEVELVADGLRSVGTAAHDHAGRPVAAVSTTWCRHHHDRDPAEVGDVLRRGAARLTRSLSGCPPAVDNSDERA